MKRNRYEVVVVGGGHAGVEAAWAAANLLPVARRDAGREAGLGAGPDARSGRGGATVALVTLDASKIGVMSCNPAIGGLAKGQLVREVDALGGLMGLATDATGIQFRVLNTSKGPAVRGPRAQCDKHAYAEEVQRLVGSRAEIEVIGGNVDLLIVERGVIVGVVVRSGSGEAVRLDARAVVLTTGTFMRGLMHTGERKTEGGRFGEGAAVGISGALRELGFELGRLKTGTPPRLKRGTIRWDDLAPQWGDAEPAAFSDLSGMGGGGELADGAGSLSKFPVLRQTECRQTHTTAAVHALIRANLHRAPMYSGQIESVGPRYCPSIEDKVVRFAERESHGVFLEPESWRDDWVYCNGISTSLPADVQDEIVRSMPGCERAEILRYGYAVEYDMVKPHQIRATGETKLVGSLFLAGQINGTSGYEEAAAQGLVAGINAAKRARGEDEVVFGREEAYIGVLMDDLVTKTPVEPYRMFTSRAEHRLLLRADNAPDRLTPKAQRLGVLSEHGLGRRREELFRARQAEMAKLDAVIEGVRVDGQPLAKRLLNPEFEFGGFLAALGGAAAITDRSAAFTVFADRKYAAYVERQRVEVRRHAEMEHRRIPELMDFNQFNTMRTEARLALARFRPSTFGQASRLEGITPADMTLLSVLVKKWTDSTRGEAPRDREAGGPAAQDGIEGSGS